MSDPIQAVVAGLLVRLGLVATRLLPHALFTSRNSELWAIDTGFQFA